MKASTPLAVLAVLAGCVALCAAATPSGGSLRILRPTCVEPDVDRVLQTKLVDDTIMQPCNAAKKAGDQDQIAAKCPTCEKEGGQTISDMGNGLVRHSEALFGVPAYAGKLTGRVWYGTPTDHTACMPYPSEPWEASSELGEAVVLLVDRGNCTFVQKVRNAQAASANAVIIVDNKHEANLPVMADDGTGNDIDIPAMFVSIEEGDKIKAAIAAHVHVRVELAWSLPQPDNRVEWSFWTSSNDDESINFVKNFKEVSAELGDAAELTPHYLIIDGNTFDCVTDQESLPCAKQCSHGGRYCAEDPEHDFDVGLDGEDVVLENLRQICIWQVTNSTGEQHKWWDYVQLFDSNCEVDEDYNERCSKEQQKLALLTAAQQTAVASCVSDSEKDTNCGTHDTECLRTANVENPLLQAEVKARQTDGIYILPSIMINTQKYRGRLTCPHPVSQETCGVLAGICAGFKFREDVPACSPDYCWKTIDDCGDCRDGPDDPKFNMMCCELTPGKGDWAPGKLKDVCGVCGGNGAFDYCNVCRSIDDEHFNNCDVIPNAQSGGSSDNSKLGAFAAVFTIIIIVLVAAMVLYIKKTNDEHRRHVENVVASYMPLDDGSGASNTPRRGEEDTASLTQGSGAM